MNQSDLIEGIVTILWRQHAGPEGLAVQLRRASHGGDPGRVAKACGISPQMLTAWERGTVRPTTTQTLTWLTYLYDSARLYDPARVTDSLREEAASAAEARRASRKRTAPASFTVDLGPLADGDRHAAARRLADTAKRASATTIGDELYREVVGAIRDAVHAGRPTAVDVGHLDEEARVQLYGALGAAAGRAAQDDPPAAAAAVRRLADAWERFTYGPAGQPANPHERVLAARARVD